LAKLVEMKSLGGTNFVRPDRVNAVQTTPTGSTVVVLEGGTIVNSSESTKVVAARLETALSTVIVLGGGMIVDSSEPMKVVAPPLEMALPKE
jgi:hypothetical protein